MTQEQVACLASPLRKELVSAFITLGPAPVREVAIRLGKRAKSLYYHVEQMEAVGLLQVVGHQPAGKRNEAVYDAVSDRFNIDAEGTPEYYGEVQRSTSNLIRLLGREYIRASNRPEKPTVLRLSMRLAPEDLEEIDRKLNELIEWVRARNDPSAPRSTLTAFLISDD